MPSYNLFLSDYTYSGAVTAKVASFSATPLNLPAVAMTKVEGGYTATVDIAAGTYSVLYQSADTPKTVEVSEVVTLGSATADSVIINRLGALLSTDYSRFSATALSNAPTGSGAGGGATPTQVTDIVVAARDAVLSRGNIAWITGNTVAPDNAGITAAKTAAERLTTVRAAKLDTVALTTDLSAIAKTTDINAAQNSIIAQGNATWTPNNTGIAAILAIVNVLRSLVNAGGTAYTSTALAAAPTGSAGPGGLLQDERLRLFSLPTVAGLLEDEREQLLALPTAVATPNQVNNVLAAINAAVIDIINRGDDSWAGSLLADERLRLFSIPTAPVNLGPVLTAIAQIPTAPSAQPTAIANAVQLALASTLAAIANDAKGAKQVAANNVFIEKDTAIVTVLDDDDVTELFKFQLLNELGEPSYEDAVKRIRLIPL
jgi:hypothetical protein